MRGRVGSEAPRRPTPKAGGPFLTNRSSSPQPPSFFSGHLCPLGLSALLPTFRAGRDDFRIRSGRVLAESLRESLLLS